MHNEVRKPREFWISKPLDIELGRTDHDDDLIFTHPPSEAKPYKLNDNDFIHCKEILPGDDSIRVSREDWENFAKFFNQDWIGPCRDIVKRIEREQETK